MAYKTCPDCGERVYNLGCVNCNEAAYIEEQERLTQLIETSDATCEHGVALDVHCCNCHSGFIFDRNHECPRKGQR